MIKESDIQRQCLDWLRANGFFASKLHIGPVQLGNGKRFAKNPLRGAPDLFCLKDAIYYGIEVKKPGGRLSSDQIRWHEEARAKGGAVILTVYSLQDMIDQLMGW